MALTTEEILIKIKTEEDGFNKINKQVQELETRLNKLASNPKGNVTNFKWFKDDTATLNNNKAALEQYTASLKKVNTELTKTGSVSPVSPAVAESLRKIAAEYDALSEKMYLYMDAGKMETLEYKNMAKQQKELVSRYHEVATSTDKASKSSQLFRKHSINLGADLVILSYGVRQTYRDISDLTEMVKKGNVNWLEFSGTVATASISLVAMTPALKAISSAFPALTGALTTFGLVAANVTAQVAMLYKVISDLPTAIDSVKQIIEGGNIWDLWINKTAELTYGLIDLRNEIDNVKISLYDLGGSMWNAYGNYLNQNVLVGAPEFNPVDDPRLIQWRKGLEDKPKKGTGNKTAKEEKQEELNLLKIELENLDKLKIKLNANLGVIGAELEIRQQILAVEERIAFLREGGTTGKDAARLINKAYLSTPSEMGLLINPRYKPGAGEGFDIEETTDTIREDFYNMVSSTQSMLQNMGLMETGFGRIVQLIMSILNTVNSGISAIGSIVGIITSFIPGAGVIGAIGGSVIGGIGGGGDNIVYNPPSGNMLETIYIVPKDSMIRGRDIYTSWQVEQNVDNLSSV